LRHNQSITIHLRQIPNKNIAAILEMQL